jgi:hypothetical protein
MQMHLRSVQQGDNSAVLHWTHESSNGTVIFLFKFCFICDQEPFYSVITSVRFREHNQVVFLQIQTAKLLPLSIIDASTLVWRDLPENVESRFLFTFSYDVRLMLMSESHVGDGVVTGISFYARGEKLMFRTNGREIADFLTGTLGRSIFDDARDYETVNNCEHRKPGSSGSQYNVSKFQTIRFGLSDQESDASQNFVPYFDGSVVTTETLTPIAGIGLMHFTGDREYAGYIKPYLVTLNYEAHIKSD